MGHYYGIASRLKVKKDAPAQLFHLLDWLYRLPGSDTYQLSTGEEGTKHVEKVFQNLERILSGCPGYMETWNWRVKEETPNYWLYESRSAAKGFDKQEFIGLLYGIQQLLVLEEGDILFRYIYEEAFTETIIYFKDGTFQTRDGHRYEEDHGFVTDSAHPYVDRFSPQEKAKYESGELVRTQRPENYFDLPWAVAEIDAAAEKKRKAREKELKRNRRNHGW